MDSSYIEANLEIIEALKAKGFKSVELVLQVPGNYKEALIELVPGMREDFEFNLILLDSPEIYDYIDGQSPMARYVIDQAHLLASSNHGI